MSVIKDENYFVTAINVAPKNEKKFAPFADVIEIKSKAKLSEHYRILAEVLNEIRKQDEMSWIWNKAKLELSYLSRAVEKNLAEFNVEGKGSAIAIDQYCITSVISCLGAIASVGLGGLSASPLCAQVITCIPACATVFTWPTCLLCLATGAAGCFACAALVLGIVSCAQALSCLGG
ncbi:MAG: hypothetical protein QXP28_08975 [Archaeoglobaceae archaeon]